MYILYLPQLILLHFLCEQMGPSHKFLVYVILTTLHPTTLSVWALETSLYIFIFSLLHPTLLPSLLWVVKTSKYIFIYGLIQRTPVVRAVVNSPASPHGRCRPHGPARSCLSPPWSRYLWMPSLPIRVPDHAWAHPEVVIFECHASPSGCQIMLETTLKSWSLNAIPRHQGARSCLRPPWSRYLWMPCLPIRVPDHAWDHPEVVIFECHASPSP